MTRRATFTFPNETEAYAPLVIDRLLRRIGLRRKVETVDGHGAAFT